MSGETHDEWCPLNGCRDGKCGPCARMPECSTPEPSEVAETTAGEREACEQPGHRCPDCSAPRFDGVFGEGADLAEEIWQAFRRSPFFNIARRDAESIAATVLASPWLAAHVSAAETKARAEERERIAEAIEADVDRQRRTPGGIYTADFAAGTQYAASIARGDAR